jgi:hypothetical protein
VNVGDHPKSHNATVPATSQTDCPSRQPAGRACGEPPR